MSNPTVSAVLAGVVLLLSVPAQAEVEPGG